MTNMHNKHCHLVCSITGKDDLRVAVVAVSLFEILHMGCENNCKPGHDTKNGHHPQNVFSLLLQLPMWYAQWYLCMQPFIFKATPSRQSIAIAMPKAEHTCTLSVCAIWLYITGAFLPLVILAGCLQSGLPFQLIRPSQFLSFSPGTAQPPARLIGSFVPSCFAEQRQNKRKCCSGTIVSTLVSKDKRKWHMNALLDR